MKKYVKSYYPIVISLLFMFVMTFLLNISIKDVQALVYSSLEFFLGIASVMLVIAIWGEIIGFIVHAIKNQKVKDSIVWFFLIYYLNIFIIPYYNLKYVIKAKKIGLKMIIFAILMIISIISGWKCANILGLDIEDTVFYFKSDDDNILLELKGNYIEKEVGEYDIYVCHEEKNINVGVLIYGDVNLTKEEIHDYRIEWIESARNNVKLMDSYKEELSDKEIISKTYCGEYEGVENVYVLSVVEFKESKEVIEVIQVCLADDYDNLKEELKEILKNVKSINN